MFYYPYFFLKSIVMLLQVQKPLHRQGLLAALESGYSFGLRKNPLTCGFSELAEVELSPNYRFGLKLF